MPQYDQSHHDVFPLRVLAYGPAKYKKTTWAANAAKSGFNVIFVDGDDGLSVVRRLDSETRKRIYRIDALDDYKVAHNCVFITKLMKQETFVWDEENKTEVMLPKNAAKENHFLIYDKHKLTINDVIVFDSWTSYVRSLVRRYQTEMKKDYTKDVVIDSDWKDYRWTGHMADWALEQMKTFPCNFVVIAHEQSFEKKDKDDPNKVILQRIQPASTSNNQALRLAKYFSDILYFTVDGAGSIFIDTRVATERDGGCRNVEPKRFKWEDCQFELLAKGAGFQSDKSELSAFRFIDYAGLQGPETASSAKIIIPPSAAADTAIAGGAAGKTSISSLMGKK